MKKLLQLNRITGGYSLQRPVPHDISFEVGAGQMIGLIGLNGAGKSTTIKHILGLMRPHSGEIRLKERLLEEGIGEYRRTYAYVPENPPLYEELTVGEHMELSAMAYGLEPSVAAVRAEEPLERFQMTPHRKHARPPFERNEAEGHDHERLPGQAGAVYHRRTVLGARPARHSLASRADGPGERRRGRYSDQLPYPYDD